ncbi:hypothetical protein ONR67_14065 [Proteus terrae]|uniref:hypothetical protein n=1 Tax=Proteus terrae TaxID=1574161 RepID=UPI0023301B82|nr:hypothetical protein [Proteus terrae]WCG89546.1 hypothetical protein ONR67_14065 [Proteus terrae]
MGSEFEAELCHLMATDELQAHQELSLSDDFERFYEALDKRRSQLTEFDKKRIEKLAYKHDEIQALFERLNLPFEFEF